MRKFVLNLALVPLSLLHCQQIWSQDPHFSQFYASPLLLNPANTGMFPGDVRLASNYRNQWKSVSTPFTTATVALDVQALKKVINERDIFGLGIVAMTDQSNNKGLKANYVTLSTAYNKTLDQNGFNKIGLGFQYTFVSKRVDYSRFVFSRQFTPSGFDVSLPTGEPMNGFSINYPDYATGLLYSGMNSGDQQWYVGASYYHFTKPNESVNGETNRLIPRFSAHGGFNFPLTDMSRVYFSGLYMKSALMTEMTAGAVLEATLNNYENPSSIYAGLFYRRNEAVIPHVGLSTGKMQIGMSYDVNISSLKTASQTRGGFEMSLKLEFAKSEDANRIPKCYNRF